MYLSYTIQQPKRWICHFQNPQNPQVDSVLDTHLSKITSSPRPSSGGSRTSSFLSNDSCTTPLDGIHLGGTGDSSVLASHVFRTMNASRTLLLSHRNPFAQAFFCFIRSNPWIPHNTGNFPTIPKGMPPSHI